MVNDIVNKVPIRLIQLSDSHLFKSEYETLLSVNTDESFKAVLSYIKQHEMQQKISALIHSGDIAQEAAVKAYQRLQTYLASFKLPVYAIPGNHDDNALMQREFNHECMKKERHLLLNDWQIIFLHTQKKGVPHGYLNQDELQHLKTCLQQKPNAPTIIIMHHHPLPIGCAWLDDIALKNADDFWQLLAPYKNIKAIFFGHIHQSFMQLKNGVMCYGTPSTSIQFKPKQSQFSLDALPQGYRWIHLYDDASLETGIIRLPHYVGHFDESAKGY